MRLNLQGTNHALYVGRGAGLASDNLAVGFNGQVLIAATGADPKFATLTSTGASITFTTGPNTLNLEAASSTPTTFTGNSGGAISPVANNINILGTTAASGTSPLVTSGAGSTITITAQRSQAIAATDSTKIGLCNFDSSSFAVDANGFVTLASGGLAIDSIGTQTGTNPIVPTGAGLVTINGAVVAAGTNPVRSDGTGANTMAIEVQISQAIASTDATKIGLSNFDSAAFSVDANGFVTLKGGTQAIDSITPNSGTTPIVPDAAGNITLVGTGSITNVGSLNTGTFQLTGLTNHALQIGAGTATLTQLGAGSTGQILQTNTTADPTWSTATYPSTATGTGTILRADGTNWLATTSTYPNTNAINTLLYASSANVMSALATANKAVLTTGATGIPVLTPIATDGTFIIGSTAGVPASGTITSTGGTITVTPGSNTINIDLAGGTTGIDSITPNSGTSPVVPTGAGLVSIVGTGSTTTVGSLNTLTVQLTGLTANSVLYGLGTATVGLVASGTTGQVLQTNTGAAPTFSTATYPSVATGTGTILRADGTNWVATTATFPATTTVSQILYSSATNVVSGLATANRGVLTTGTTGIPAITALATDGQLIIGSTAGSPAAATLTAGTGVSITNASNAITVNAVGGGVTWSVVTVNASFTVNTGTIANKAGVLTMTLPATAAIGDIIEITGINTALGWTIAQNANQQILFGTSSTTIGVGGSISSINIRDSLKMVCVVAGSSTRWNVLSSVGSMTIV